MSTIPASSNTAYSIPPGVALPTKKEAV